MDTQTDNRRSLVPPLATAITLLVIAGLSGCDAFAPADPAAAPSAATPAPESDGTVASDQKVSSTQGLFAGPLNDEDWFGQSIGAPGDLDGDNVPDLLVGATEDDDGGEDQGAVWILYLNPDGTVRGQTKVSELAGGFTGMLSKNDNFGASVAGVGDIDRDGAIDIVVGSPDYEIGAASISRGAVGVLFLNDDGTLKSHQRIDDSAGAFSGMLDNGDKFGASIAEIGYLDGDGTTDIAVGAWGDDDGGFNRGAIGVLYLTDDGNVKSHTKISDIAGGFGGGS